MRSVILGLVLLSVSSSFAQRQSRDLDPVIAVSPSGDYKFVANPSDRNGGSTCLCSLTYKGATVYTVTRPYSFYGAAVTDGGLAGGYGYEGGMTSNGSIFAEFLDRTGTVSFSEQMPRQPPTGFHMPSTPIIMQCEQLPATNILRLRPVFGYDMLQGKAVDDEWWTYDLTKPAAHQTIPIELPAKEGVRLVSTQPVKGTQLDLCVWHTFVGPKYGIAYTLSNRRGKIEWSLMLPTDISEAAPKYRDKIDELTIAKSDQAKSFELHLLKPDQRVSFAISETDGKVAVTETERTPYLEKSVPSSTPNIPLRALVAGPKLVLPLKQTSRAVRGVGEFFLFGKDMIVYEGDRNELTVSDLKGKPVRRIKLPAIGDWHQERKFARVGPSGLVVFTSTSGDTYKSEAIKVDLATGKTASLNGLKEPAIKCALGFPDGRMVVACEEVIAQAMHSYVDMLDANGQRLWRIVPGDVAEDEKKMDSVDDLFLTPKGEIGSLNNISHTISFLDQKGNFLRKIFLEKSWATFDNYLTHAAADSDGNIYLLDFAGKKAIKKINSAGKLLGERALLYKDGKMYTSSWGLQVDNKGRLWVTDGRALIRLGPDGKPELFLGTPVVSSGLAEIAQLTVSSEGIVTVFDGQTAELQQFSRDGALRFRTKTLKDDFPTRPIQPRAIRLAGTGDIYLDEDWLSMANDRGILHFRPNGEREGWHEIGKDDGKGALPEEFRASWRWSEDKLVDENNVVIGRLDRWPDLRWRDDTDPLIAPDGRLAVLGTPGYSSYRLDAAEYAAFYGPTGKPEAMVKLSFPLTEIRTAAFDGETIYVLREKDLVAFGRDGKCRWRSDTKGQGVFATREGLAIWDGAGTVTWYSLASEDAESARKEPVWVKAALRLDPLEIPSPKFRWLQGNEGLQAALGYDRLGNLT